MASGFSPRCQGRTLGGSIVNGEMHSRDARGPRQNPFATTKAADFSDSEIDQTWVDWPASGGFADLMHVQSPMPRLIKGGKGTGRTHVLRHFSAAVQAIRAKDGSLAQVLADQVLGVYAPCSGLNASRFRGRGIEEGAWQATFIQYVDVWLAQAALGAFRLVTRDNPPDYNSEVAIVKQILSSFVTKPSADLVTLADVEEWMFAIQKSIDAAIAHALVSREFPADFTLWSSPGDLVFGVPKAIQDNYDSIADVNVLYLIDELELFGVEQQKYINTLIREAHPRVSFIIGVRSYGLRTLETLGTGEVNKLGSEFEEIDLDRKAVDNQQRVYYDFCRRMVVRRLEGAGIAEDRISSLPSRSMATNLRSMFELARVEEEEAEMRRRYPAEERPYLTRLRRQLHQAGRRTQEALGIVGNEESIVEALRIPQRPLLEKANVLMLYRAWYRGLDLREVAESMRDQYALQQEEDPAKPTAAQSRVLHHFGTDLRAQMVRDMRQRQTYSGMDQFVAMSMPLPRNLLVILKNIYRWSMFRGEEPFRHGRISVEAQRLGVREAAEWFLADAKSMGREWEDVQQAIRRLGNMYRLFRFSDKPVESSLATFSGDVGSCSPRTQMLIGLASDQSLLVQIDKGQKDRNSGIVEPKYQLNGLLSPLWDLPTARRGTVHLGVDELEAIFNPPAETSFRDMMSKRLSRMRTPFGRVSGLTAMEPELFEWEGEV